MGYPCIMVKPPNINPPNPSTPPKPSWVRKKHTIAFVNWMQNRGPFPACEITADVSTIGKIPRASLYLGYIPKLGIFKITKGITVGGIYTVAGKDEASASGTNKILVIQKIGSEDQHEIYLRKNEINHRSGIPVEVDITFVNKALSPWLNRKGPKPPRVTAMSNEIGVIHLGTHMGKSIELCRGIKPEAAYQFDFFEEPLYETTSLGLDVYDCSDGVLVDRYYLFYYGHSYTSACSRSLAEKDHQSHFGRRAHLRPSKEARTISTSVREILEENTPLSLTPFPLLISNHGSAHLTTLSNGSPVELGGLGCRKRLAEGRLEQRNDQIVALVYERGGIINWYVLRTKGQICPHPISQIAGKKGTSQEVSSIMAEFGISADGKIADETPFTTFENEIAQCPPMEDPFYFAWWTHRLLTAHLIISGERESVSKVAKKLWLVDKIPRSALMLYMLTAAELQTFFNLPPTIRSLPPYRSYLELFSELDRHRGDCTLSRLIKALFVGGAIAPRSRFSHLVQLARGYEVAQKTPALLTAPNFGDDFGEALRFLLLIKTTRPLYALFYALIVQNKLATKQFPMKLAGAYILSKNAARFIEDASYDPAALRSSSGAKYSPDILFAVRELLVSPFAGEDKNELLQKLADKARKLPRSEAELNAFAFAAPTFSDPFSAARWLCVRGIASYSLSHQLAYLERAGKLRFKCHRGTEIILAAYDYAARNMSQVFQDISKAIRELPVGTPPEPYNLTKELHGKVNWKEERSGKLISAEFMFWVIIASFRLSWSRFFGIALKRVSRQTRQRAAGGNYVPSGAPEAEKFTGLESLVKKKIEGKKYKDLEIVEIDLLLEQVKKGNGGAEELLSYFYSPIIRAETFRFCRKHRQLNFEHLLSVGEENLITIAQKYAPVFGTKFSGYLGRGLTLYFYRELKHEAGIVRRPAYFMGQINRVRREINALLEEDGQAPSTIVIAARLKISPEEVDFTLQRAEEAYSMDAPLGFEDEGTLHSKLPDGKAQTDNPILDTETCRIVRQALENTELPPNQRKILELRYMEDPPLSLTEVGLLFGLSREWIRQLEIKGLKALREGSYASALAELASPD
ncbi:MAG: sigma factor-like helix-turn-helix DNA-binding protein [Candidatus Margulisiibacteriota bacterium]